MPRGDMTGPPEGSMGPRSGQGMGRGWAPGAGTGPMTGGQRNVAERALNRGLGIPPFMNLRGLPGFGRFRGGGRRRMRFW